MSDEGASAQVPLPPVVEGKDRLPGPRRWAPAVAWEAWEGRLLRRLRFNPAVAVLELRTRLRERRAYGQLACSIIGTCATALITYWIAAQPYYGQSSDVPLGGTVFLALAMAQLTLMLLIVPGYAAATLTIEREKGTLELVQASLLTAGDVVTGKLAAAYAYTMMLLFTSLPVASWCLMLGGLDLIEIVLCYSYLSIVAIGAIALGLLVASFARKTVAAFSATTGILLLVLVGVPLALAALASVLNEGPFAGEGTLVVEFWVVLGLGCALGWRLYVVFTRYFDAAAENLASARLSMKSFASILAISVSGVFVFVVGTVVLSSSLQSALGLLALLHPHGALLGILQSAMLEDLLSEFAVSAAWRGAAVWAATSLVSLVSGLALWYLAVVAFGFSWRRDLRQAAKE